MVTINRFSWLLRDQLREKGGIQFWDYFESPLKPEEIGVPREDDIEYTVQSFDRIDNLAQRFYGDPQLWWVIALANDLRLLPNQLNCGIRIRIPSPAFVQERMLVPRTDEV